MRSRYHALFVVLFIAGCAASSVEPTSSTGAVADAGAPPARRRCDEVITGSRIPQCNRGDVKVISHDELDRKGTLNGDPWPTREGLAPR